MKIGYLLHAGAPDVRIAPFSGPANHVRQVFKELQTCGHEVRLIAYLDGQIWKSDDLERYKRVTIPWLDREPGRIIESGIRRVQSIFQLPYFALFESVRFGQACLRELAGFDLLYERMGWFGFGGCLGAQWLQIPRVLEINGELLNEMELLGVAPRGLQRLISFNLMSENIHQASGYVSTGKGWQARFAQQWEIEPERVLVVENGTEILRFLQREQLQSFQEEAQYPRKTQVVFIGSFDPWQGIDILVEAFARAIQNGANLQLSLIGSGPRLPAIQHMVKEHDLGESVKIMGWLSVPEMAACLAAADIGVSPYCGRAEFSGLKLVDYKAAGLAIIASGQDSQPSILRHSQTGWIVPPCDVLALSEAMIHLSLDSGLRRRLGQAARIEAEKYHSWQQTAQELNHLFSQLILKN